MKPKYLKQAREAHKDKRGKDSTGEGSITERHGENQESNIEGFHQECDLFGANHDESSLKLKHGNQNRENKRTDDIRQSEVDSSEEKFKEADLDKKENIERMAKHTEKYPKKQSQRTNEGIKIKSCDKSDKLKRNFAGNASNVKQRNVSGTSRQKKTELTTEERSDNKLQAQTKTQLPSRIRSSCQDENESNDVKVHDLGVQMNKSRRSNTSQQPQCSGREKALLHVKIPTQSSTERNRLIDNIYRTMVRIKGENVSLTEVTDLMAKYADININGNHFDDLVSLFEQNEDKFAIVYWNDEPLISARTTVSICSIFTNDPRNQHSCNDLHVCKYVLLSKCQRKDCKFGHNLSSKHNKDVFRNYGLDGIEKDSKMSLIRNVSSRNISTTPLICKFYNNEGGCKNKNKCSHLHICKNYINDDCKFGRKCKRCHNLMVKQSMSVLGRYGLTPESHNYRNIISLLKDTLDDGEVQLKRNISTNRVHRTREHTERTFSDVSEESVESVSEYDDNWSTSDESEQCEKSGQQEYDSDLEYAAGADILPIDDTLVTNTKQDRVKPPSEKLYDRDLRISTKTEKYEFSENQSDAIKSVMTFDSHLEDKQFTIRSVNGSWEIRNKSGPWLHIELDESEQLLQLHDDFIRLAEKNNFKQTLKGKVCGRV